MNEKLNKSELERMNTLIDSIPYDGTDWDGISPDTLRVFIDVFEKAKKLDKIIDDLNSRRESNIKQREIELTSKSGSKAFAYQLEWGVDLISAILNYDFYKGRNYLELEQENKQLKEKLKVSIK